MKKSKWVFACFWPLLIFVLSGCLENKDYAGANTKSQPVAEDSRQWELSPEFTTSEGDLLIGEDKKVGIVGPEFIEGETNKWLWHFWSDEQTIEGGEFKVVATHKETGVKEKALVENAGTANVKKVWNYGKLDYSPDGVRGSDSSRPSNMSLSKPGTWRLEVSIGSNYFGTIVVHVKGK
ncbi:hypothetical protein [Bacillus sp. FJAT-27445]|uniref:hypothetical protein n=1 Tax=Bacillus sp. FJAT-27445 TaxID=1679166 RepID=UPI0007432F3F|nr:hypothetical protein [Bacillus sp. FJAT-27445]